MKTQTPFKPLLLLVLLVAAGSFSTKAQVDTCAVNVIHTYMNGRLIPCDSVEVRVCLPPCEYPYHYRTFKMYWPDTILSNCTTGVDEYVQDNEWGLSQSFPNPCVGESRVKLTTRTAGSVKLQVTDLQGRLCCQRTELLPTGEHQLLLTLPHSGVYFVQAETNEGRKVSKVLCTEGRGSGFDIRVSSSSYQIEKKADRGGEGLFGMTDYMQITAYITYNGNVYNGSVLVNHTFDDWVYISDSLYRYGSVNIHFLGNEGCEDFSLSGNTFDMLIAYNSCQPFMDYPLGSIVSFSDSTLYSTPTSLFQYFSSTWWFSGEYKYRYYPQLNNMLCIFPMSETLPPENIDSTSDLEEYNYYSRYLRLRTCDVVLISLYSQVQGYFDNELMIRDE